MDDEQLKKLLENLECPVCTNYMVSPIFVCSKGHSICNACYPAVKDCPTCRAPNNDSRNYTLEKIVEDLNILCKYTQRGCRFTDNGGDINNHVEYCDFGDVKCLSFSCQWTGQRQDLLNHYWIHHPEYTREYNNVCFWYNNFVDQKKSDNSFEVFMINAYDKPFMFFWKFAKPSGHMPWCVYYLGDPKDAGKYSYQLLIKHSTFNKGIIKIEAECQPIKNNYSLDELSNNCKSMILHYKLLALYCTEKGSLLYDVYIIKLDK